jgi:integrase
VEAFISHLVDTRSASTASVRFRALQQFFAWLVDEMRAPIVPEQPVPILDKDACRRLLKACDGKEFADRRDTAIVRMFLDTGLRLSELAYLTVAEVDLDDRARAGPRQGWPATRRAVRGEDGGGARSVPAGPGTPAAGS